MVSVVGDVAVYVCNPNRRVITCSSSYLDRAIGFIEDNCPVNRAGKYHRSSSIARILADCDQLRRLSSVQ
jgi:hypothetical protein